MSDFPKPPQDVKLEDAPPEARASLAKEALNLARDMYRKHGATGDFMPWAIEAIERAMWESCNQGVSMGMQIAAHHIGAVVAGMVKKLTDQLTPDEE